MKKQIKNLPLILAIPVVLVGTLPDEKINFAPCGQCGQISYEPPTVYISVVKEKLTAEAINKTQKFSINIPTPKILEKLKICGNVSGKDRDKSGIFDVFYGKENIPLISSCPINLSCKVVKTVELNDMMIYYGEITETFVDEDCLSGDMPDTYRTNPLLCSLDGKFWSLVNGEVTAEKDNANA